MTLQPFLDTIDTCFFNIDCRKSYSYLITCISNLDNYFIKHHSDSIHKMLIFLEFHTDNTTFDFLMVGDQVLPKVPWNSHGHGLCSFVFAADL
jgi:hypothetical protein